MYKKISSVIFSTRLMAFLFLFYAIAMAIGTFVESKYNTDTARILIYNAWWFEAIHLFFVINFFGNISRFKLWRKEKWATLLLHLSFIFIIIGAAITRYISFEGMMPIREGATENVFYSDKSFITINVDGEYKGESKRRVFEKSVIFSGATSNHFSLNADFSEIPFTVKLKEFLMGANQIVKENKNGTLYFKMVESGSGQRKEHFLKSGEIISINSILFALNKETKGAININTTVENAYTIQTPFEGNFMRMADKMEGKVTINNIQPLMMRSLYNVAGLQFVFPETVKKGNLVYEATNNFKDKGKEDALIFEIESQGKTQEITVLGAKGKRGELQNVKIGKLDFSFAFGSKTYELPFSIKLNDFIAKKYPGTEKSFSSFESQVTLTDGKEKFDARIFMNNILDHKGYRFFQSQFDPDEKGTILSVNHDFWGTWITYLGYFLLFFAMTMILFVKNTRFADLKKRLEIIKEKKANLTLIVLLLLTLNGFSQNHQEKIPTQKQIDSVLDKRKISEQHAEKFGRLIIQDAGGRMKPVNTFSSELLRKVSHSDVYNKMNADQVFVSMTQYPEVWYEVPIIYIEKGNDSIRKIIGIPNDQKFAKFINFFDKDGKYKLSPFLDEAYRKANPNKFEKGFVETDKKVNLLNSALAGSILKIFPIPNDANNKWASYAELGHTKMSGMDSVFTKQILPIYLQSLENASATNQYKESDFYLDGIQKFQNKYGKSVLPSSQKIDAEILYNKYDVFQKLLKYYLYASILMLFLVILQIFKERKILKYAVNTMHIIIGLLFCLHTIGLIARWYISGHAPWSNAYESIIYVSWSTMLFGLIFDRKSKLTIASAAFVASLILWAAYLNWIDPEIANLQPVLNSYWLMIHVAIIVACYGPFALGMILGFVSLLLIFFTTEKNKSKMDLNIQEITIITEMALTIGLVMLTIGNFLGGQWANESWGRYWGWDPKETWALISIMVYAFVIHSRFVPALRGRWSFNLMAMFAFVSIMFTYFGVNFHLVGLHSYASGEAKSLDWIYYTLAAISLIGAITYPKYRKHYKK